MTEEQDQKIIQKYKSGNHQEALKLLLNAYQQRLYWQIRRLLSNHDDTDDVLQNTIIKAWRGLGNFQGNSKLHTWLFRIAANESFSFLEKNKKFELNVSLEEDYTFKSDNNPGDLSGGEIQKKLEQALLTLPEKQRLVFHLKYYEDLKYSEISDVLGTSVGALKANYHLAVKKIEEFLTTH